MSAAVTGLGLPARLTLAPGQADDRAAVPALLAGLRPAVVVADRGYDSRAAVDAIRAAGAEAVVPTLSTRAEQRAVDPALYAERNLVERFWAKAKQYRRGATRYDKTARNFLAFLHVAPVMLLLQ